MAKIWDDTQGKITSPHWPVAFRCIAPMSLQRHWSNASARHRLADVNLFPWEVLGLNKCLCEQERGDTQAKCPPILLLVADSVRRPPPVSATVHWCSPPMSAANVRRRCPPPMSAADSRRCPPPVFTVSAAVRRRSAADLAADTLGREYVFFCSFQWSEVHFL